MSYVDYTGPDPDQERIDQMRQTIRDRRDVQSLLSPDAVPYQAPPQPPQRGFWGSFGHGLVQSTGDMVSGLVGSAADAVRDPTGKQRITDAILNPPRNQGEYYDRTLGWIPTYPIGKALGQAFKSATDSGDTGDVGTHLGEAAAATLAMFAGPKAKGANLDALATAKLMAKRKGITPMDTWRETGWHQAPDGRWKFEIPDADSKIIDPKGERLGQVLDHPALYKAYPWLKDLPVYAEDLGGANASMQALGRTGRGYIKYDPANMPKLGGDEWLRQKMLHEVQHHIQANEGFSGGGNPITAPVQDLPPEWRNSGQHVFWSAKMMRDYAGGDVDKFARMFSDDYERLTRTPGDLANAVTIARDKDMFDDNLIRSLSGGPPEFEAYKRLKGETEARNTEKRADLTRQDRLYRPPWETADYPPDQQLNNTVHEQIKKLRNRRGYDQPASLSADDDKLQAKWNEPFEKEAPRGGFKSGLADYSYPTPIRDMSFERRPTGLLQPSYTISPEKLEGTLLSPAVGDPTAAGYTLTHVGGQRLSKPVDLQGGADFTRAGRPWASDQGVITKIADQAAVARLQGKPLNLVYSKMGPTSGDFSHHMSDTLMGQMPSAEIAKKNIASFDQAMKVHDPQWPGVLNDTAARQRLATVPDLRNKFATEMDKADRFKQGFPNMATSRAAITEGGLLQAPYGASGRTISRIDEQPTIHLDTAHNTYPVSLTGRYVGGLEQSIPREVMFPDFFKARLKEEARLPANRIESARQRSFGMSHVLQPANAQWLEGVMKWLERQRQGG